ncbi:MAG: DUF2267 domain-containing protein [Candidatus Thiodiazotropha sp. (ex Dulcina madagascariensis)]|nr:DUF2267 domain-containing protein [Candidatus Thiodiazotropha sp. (ex Dulcina madagascariensis)]
MPVPFEYSRAADHFYEFLLEARDTAELGSTHQAYTMTQGVLQAFRRRLDFKGAILFASVLPVGLRALFVADWDTDEPKRQFEGRADMTQEVQALRVAHNFAPDTAIRDVAYALRQHVDETIFDSILARLPEGAVDFWKP